MDGSVAEARRSRGRLLSLELRVEESRRDIDRESGGEAMTEVCCDETVVFVVLDGKVFVDLGRVCWLGVELFW